MIITIPLRTVNSTNAREHWRARAQRVRKERGAVKLLWRIETLGKAQPVLPCAVSLVRIAPRTLDAHDNLRCSFKAIVDELTTLLGATSDADPRITWNYSQRRGSYAVQIQIEEQR